MLAIFKREFKSYFTGVVGSIFIAFLLCCTGFFVYMINLTGGYSSFEQTLTNIIFIFLLAVPLLTMRSFAEERHAKTDQLLYSLPLSVSEIVLGKYFAMLAVLLIPCLIMVLIPILLSAFGYMAYKSAYLALFAFFILGAALIALCMFMSSLTESQVLAAILGFGALLFMYLMSVIASAIPQSAYVSLICFIALALVLGIITYAMTKNLALSGGIFGILTAALIVLYLIKPALFTGLFGSLLTYLAVFDRFVKLTIGVFDITAIIYLISFAAFFVYLTVQSVEKRRWS